MEHPGEVAAGEEALVEERDKKNSKVQRRKDVNVGRGSCIKYKGQTYVSALN